MPDIGWMSQDAKYPFLLEDLVKDLTYRPGWRTTVEHLDRGQGSVGLTLCIYTVGYDTYNIDAGQTYRVVHFFPVPPAAYDLRSWRRWLFERFLDVERHECAEFFQIGDDRPYAPHHGPGNDPYIIFDHGTEQDVKTNFRGEVSD